jgi:hypothetical protein
MTIHRESMNRRIGLRLLRGLTVAALLLSAVNIPARAQTAPEFTLADGRIRFVAPPGFTEMSAALLAAKYPNGGAPRHAVSDSKTTTSIAFDLQDQRLPTSDPDVLRKALTDNFAQLPKLKWISNEVRDINGRKWGYLEFTAAAADQGIHNIILASAYDGRLLLFNFNSTVAEFPKVESALRTSIGTIRVAPQPRD